jgi:ATP-dependent RNA helicase DBP3
MAGSSNIADGSLDKLEPEREKRKKKHNGKRNPQTEPDVKLEKGDKQGKKRRRKVEQDKRETAAAMKTKDGSQVEAHANRKLGSDSCSIAAVGDKDLARDSKPIIKDLYKEHASLAAMQTSEVDRVRKEWDITVKGTEKTPIISFDHLGLRSALMHAVKGFKVPTPIQAQCWPLILSGEDLIGIASTGSGMLFSQLQSHSGDSRVMDQSWLQL